MASELELELKELELDLRVYISHCMVLESELGPLKE